jgi:hypothetical protein
MTKSDELMRVIDNYASRPHFEKPQYREDVVAALEAALKPGNVVILWANFPAYLIDKCEGDTISEEGLQRALAEMLRDPQYTAPQAQTEAMKPEKPERLTDEWLDFHCFSRADARIVETAVRKQFGVNDE